MSTAAIPIISNTTTPPPLTLMTATEFVSKYGDAHAELVRGIVRELPMPMPRHGVLCFQVSRIIGNWVMDRDLGRMMINDSFVRIRSDPDTVRGPDVSYYSYASLAKGPLPTGLLAVSPELVVEVKSPSDRWSEVFVKVGEYLGIGVKVVLVLDDESQTVSVYRPEALQEILKDSAELALPEVLPGFSCNIADFFK